MMQCAWRAGSRVSIVVLTYNRFEELCRTLERLLALPQRYPVIVVDNGGTDGTAARLKHRFPGVLLVRVIWVLRAEIWASHTLLRPTLPFVTTIRGGSQRRW